MKRHQESVDDFVGYLLELHRDNQRKIDRVVNDKVDHIRSTMTEAINKGDLVMYFPLKANGIREELVITNRIRKELSHPALKITWMRRDHSIKVTFCPHKVAELST